MNGVELYVLGFEWIILYILLGALFGFIFCAVYGDGSGTTVCRLATKT